MMTTQIPMAIADDFTKAIGMPIEKVIDLYTRAVENDWRTVQKTTQSVIAKFAESRGNAHEAAELLNLARAVLGGENKDHLQRAGLPEINP